MSTDTFSADVDRLREAVLRSTGDRVSPAEFADQTWQTIEEEPEELDGDTMLGDGDLLGGRYRIDQQIGRGGMGRVYSGEHVGLGRPVAIKILAGHRSGVNVAARRFAAEGRAAAAVSHPGIVDVLDSGELDDGRLYLVMEKIDGRTLAEELDTRAPLPWREACELVAEIADALAAAHRRGLIHRDLKPSNIMFSADGGRRRPKILDFGIAADTSQISDVRMTRPGQLLGTPLYMAPEQADALAPTPQMDLYALGSILFHALTGAAPFADEEPFSIVARKRRDPSPSLASRRDDLPAALVRLVDRCLALDPLERPHSAAAIEGELRQILASPDAPYRERRRAPVRFLSLAGGAVVVGLVTGLALLGAVGGSEDGAAPVDDAARGGALEGGVAAEKAQAEQAEQAEQVQQVQQVETVEPAPEDRGGVYASSEHPEDAGAPDGRESPNNSENSEKLENSANSENPENPENPGGRDVRESLARRVKPKLDAADGPAPAPGPAKKATKAASSRCELVRRAANESRRAYNWADVLRQTAKASCWSDRVERSELRVKAHLELGDYRQCIEEGDGVADRKIKAMVAICARRIGA